MRLTEQDRIRLRSITEELKADPSFRSMETYVQHGVVDTLSHVKNVAAVSLWLSEKLGLDVNRRTLITGALLHDFYLYDWHGAGWRHSYRHPEAARRNAVEHYGVDEATQDVIACHMWPINPTRVPSSAEAWLVTVADKIVSAHETLFQRKGSVTICS